MRCDDREARKMCCGGKGVRGVVVGKGIICDVGRRGVTRHDREGRSRGVKGEGRKMRWEREGHKMQWRGMAEVVMERETRKTCVTGKGMRCNDRRVRKM